MDKHLDDRNRVLKERDELERRLHEQLLRDQLLQAQLEQAQAEIQRTRRATVAVKQQYQALLEQVKQNAPKLYQQLQEKEAKNGEWRQGL